MRKPTRRKSPRAQNASVYSTAAPTGGWNTYNSVAEMPPQDAVKLLNWFPTTVDCEIRKGNAAHATGITGTVKTLAVYNRMGGTNSLFASDENDIWNVSSAGAATAQSTTVTVSKWQFVNFGDGTNNYLIMVNGTDAPLYYNGTSWVVITGVSSPSLAGPTLTKLIHVNEHKGRIYFLEKDSLSFWYLPAGAAGGTLVEFDLSSFASKGGYLMWMANWTFDSGNGPDDAAVFMTSEGEVIIYRGTDPSTAANWVLDGVFFLGKPIGRRSFIKFAGDLMVTTQNGVYPLSSGLQSASIDKTAAITSKIEHSFNEASRNYGSTFGWDVVQLFQESALIFNIPVVEGGEHKQYVMNTITKSWCEFDSWDGECFAVFNDDLYFGLSTKVQKAWSGRDDDGANITAIAKTAFSYFGNASQQKRMTMFRPMLQVNGSIGFLTGMDVDFSDNEITGVASYTNQAGALYDTAKWDEGYWAAGLTTVRVWRSPIENVGYAFSAGIKVSTNSLNVKWVANDYVYESGGVL